MLKTIKQNWNSFAARPDIWFFYAFLLTSTLSIRKVIYFFPINNSFNEYTGVYIYLSDILLILTFLSYALCNKTILLSNIKSLSSKIYNQARFFHACSVNCSTWNIANSVECFQKTDIQNSNCSTWNNFKNASEVTAHLSRKIVPRGTILFLKSTYAQIINNYLVFFPLFIVFFSFISILWATNGYIAFYRSIKLLEFILSYFYIIAIVPPARNAISQGLSQESYNQYSIVPRGTIWKNFVAGGRGTIAKIITSAQNKLNKMFHVEHFANQQNGKTIIEGAELNSKGNCSTWNILQNILLIIILTGLFQAIMGITQFFKQSSIGLFWLKESIISQNMTGVAKTILNNEAYIRAYGLFPHPNILGGFLVLSFIASLVYFKMFHVEHFENTITIETKNCSTWNILKNIFDTIVQPARNAIFYNLFKKDDSSNQIVPRGTFWKSFVAGGRGTIVYMILLIQIVALILTFSKSAIIGLSVGLIHTYYQSKNKIVPRGTIDMMPNDSLKESNCSTWNILSDLRNFISELFHVEHFAKKFILICSILIMSLIVLKPDINSLFIKSLQEREFYLNVSRGTFFSHPLLGVGTGQFVPQLANMPGIQIWQYQPVHNVFLLILNEFGIFMLLGFAYFLFKMFHVEHFKQGLMANNNNLNAKKYIRGNCRNVPRETFANILIYFKALLVSSIFIMLFDHYFWDIQQGQILLWMTLGLIAGLQIKRRGTDEERD